MVGTQNELMDPAVKSEVRKTVFSNALDIKIKKQTLQDKLCSYLAARLNTATVALELGEDREVKIPLAAVI
jgi:hypothetical protein